MTPRTEFTKCTDARTVEYEEALSKAADKADLARRFSRSVTET
jgi:hypothetical protein